LKRKLKRTRWDQALLGNELPRYKRLLAVYRIKGLVRTNKQTLGTGAEAVMEPLRCTEIDVDLLELRVGNVFLQSCRRAVLCYLQLIDNALVFIKMSSWKLLFSLFNKVSWNIWLENKASLRKGLDELGW
jgi:hypothetical protein